MFQIGLIFLLCGAGRALGAGYVHGGLDVQERRDSRGEERTTKHASETVAERLTEDREIRRGLKREEESVLLSLATNLWGATTSFPHSSWWLIWILHSIYAEKATKVPQLPRGVGFFSLSWGDVRRFESLGLGWEIRSLLCKVLLAVLFIMQCDC